MDVGESYRLARGGSRDLPEARDKGILGPRGGTHRGLSQGNRNVKEWSPKVDPHEGKALISPQPPPPNPPPQNSCWLKTNLGGCPWCTLAGDGGSGDGSTLR